MLAWIDDEALARTMSTGRATYWSRSRREYWAKGDTAATSSTSGGPPRLRRRHPALQGRPGRRGLPHRRPHVLRRRPRPPRRWLTRTRRGAPSVRSCCWASPPRGLAAVAGTSPGSRDCPAPWTPTRAQRWRPSSPSTASRRVAAGRRAGAGGPRVLGRAPGDPRSRAPRRRRSRPGRLGGPGGRDDRGLLEPARKLAESLVEVSGTDTVEHLPHRLVRRRAGRRRAAAWSRRWRQSSWCPAGPRWAAGTTPRPQHPSVTTAAGDQHRHLEGPRRGS